MNIEIKLKISWDFLLFVSVMKAFVFRNEQSRDQNALNQQPTNKLSLKTDQKKNRRFK